MSIRRKSRVEYIVKKDFRKGIKKSLTRFTGRKHENLEGQGLIPTSVDN